jgi:hypothetical protein
MDEGIPAKAFASGQGRWLGVQAEGEPERPRTSLVSVPYALRAVDAEALGGLLASAYALASAPAANLENSVAAGPANPGKSGITPQDLTVGGSAGYVAM